MSHAVLGRSRLQLSIISPQTLRLTVNSPEKELQKQLLSILDMASRTLSKTIASRLARQLKPAVQQRTFAALTAAARPTVARAAVAGSQVQSRGVKTVDFAGHKEQVFERADWPREKLLVRYYSRKQWAEARS
jgi:hypothetical protein